MFYSKIAGKEIPMLSLSDDGHGMSHADIQRMISFGHGQTEVDDPNHIGMYGIGFKVLLHNPALLTYSDLHKYFQQNIAFICVLPKIVTARPY